MRSWRSELMSMATVLAVPVAIALVFPYAALDFQGRTPVRRPHSSVALVELTPEAEAAAIRAAKTNWRGADDHSRSDLKLGELPSPETAPVLDIAFRTRPAPSLPPQPALPGYLPSAAAAAPKPLPQDGVLKSEAAFSQGELLEIH